MGYNAVYGFRQELGADAPDETMDFFTRDGTAVKSEFRINKTERPTIRNTTKTITHPKRKVVK